MFAASLVALSLISVSAADYAVHNVIVGGDALPNALLFQPETVSACAGDIVRFTFMRKNHTVTQTSFDSVCNPLLDPYTHDPVFDSGFRPVAANQTSDPYTLDYNVKNSDTVWMYCRQTGHCKQGMLNKTRIERACSSFSRNGLRYKST
jgi:plastocyanin